MLIGIKRLGLDLHQFTIALLAIHTPVTDTDVIDKGHVAFLPVHQKGPFKDFIKHGALFGFAPVDGLAVIVT